MSLKEKKVLLGVTGSIASYKSCELIRRLKMEGAEVKAVMTKNATEFITPLTLRTLSENPVYLDMFKLQDNLVHIRLTEWADLIIVAPATANIIAKTACGIADDLLSTLLCAFRGPVIFAPAMDEGMYENPVLREHCQKLQERGYHILPAVRGALASGKIGRGRLTPVEQILRYLTDLVSRTEDFKGAKVLVTAGGTREYLDPVRFIGNPSSGKMGYALAEAVKLRGGEVKLITAPTFLPPPGGVKVIHVTTALEMKEKVMENLPPCDIVIMASAVGDYRPERVEKKKRKRTGGKWDISLIPNPDILSEVSRDKKGKIVVGFSVEIERQIEKAKEKLKKKRMDLVVANDITREDSGFGKDTNKATLIDKYGTIEELPVLTKSQLAHKILDKVKEIQKREY